MCDGCHRNTIGDYLHMSYSVQCHCKTDLDNHCLKTMHYFNIVASFLFEFQHL